MSDCELDIRLSDHGFDPYRETEAFRQRAGDIGAMASFIGYVRGEDGAVTELTLEHFPGFTEKRLADLCAGSVVSFAIRGLMVVHRVGAMKPGDPVVLVAAASAHRADALGAVECVMDILKTDAPLWKKETGPDGARWIEPRASDHDARKRWATE